MTLFIDDRIGSKDLVDYEILRNISELCNMESDDDVFPCGDAAFTGNGPNGPIDVGVELKSLGDLITSSIDGRLQDTQIRAMLKTFDISYLLFYGQYKAHPIEKHIMVPSKRGNTWEKLVLGKRSYSVRYLEGLLIDVADYGIRVKHAINKLAAAEWLHMLYKNRTKEWKHHKRFDVFDESGPLLTLKDIEPGLRQRAKVAKAFPRVGYDKAMAVGRYFNTVREMINADSWEMVDGIGKTINTVVQDCLD